jgi:hypothetical protein
MDSIKILNFLKSHQILQQGQKCYLRHLLLNTVSAEIVLEGQIRNHPRKANFIRGQIMNSLLTFGPSSFGLSLQYCASLYMEEIAVNTTCWCIFFFCKEHGLRYFFAQNTKFCCKLLHKTLT